MTEEYGSLNPITLLKELRDTTPITAQRKRIDAFFANLEGKLGAAMIEAEYAADQRREISQVDHGDLRLMLVHQFRRMQEEEGTSGWDNHDYASEAVRLLSPYLRTTEPVFSADDADVMARTLESIHGDAECFLKQLCDNGISRKSMNVWLKGIYQKANSIRHITRKAWEKNDVK